MRFELKVNNAVHQIEASEDTPLLWILRDFIGLTGTKFGCGKGLCGACTVNLDGQAARSCLVTVANAAGKDVKTIESFAQSHPNLIQIWAARNVAQCGYCQPGQIVSAASLLDKNSSPSDAEIDTAMNGNICRCGAYGRIKSAIQEASRSSS